MVSETPEALGCCSLAHQSWNAIVFLPLVLYTMYYYLLHFRLYIWCLLQNLPISNAIVVACFYHFWYIEIHIFCIKCNKILEQHIFDIFYNSIIMASDSDFTHLPLFETLRCCLSIMVGLGRQIFSPDTRALSPPSSSIFSKFLRLENISPHIPWDGHPLKVQTYVFYLIRVGG